MSPAPHNIPEAAAQNRKTKSIGSLMGVLKRTMERAPTIPSEMTILVEIPMMIKAVAIVIMIREMLKLWEYITPEKVFLYMTYINKPMAKANSNPMRESIIEKLSVLSKKLDLKISLKLVVFVFVSICDASKVI